jgi:hypothetical protein
MGRLPRSANKIGRSRAARSGPRGIEFASDSPLAGTGFEPAVPPSHRNETAVEGAGGTIAVSDLTLNTKRLMGGSTIASSTDIAHCSRRAARALPRRAPIR